MWKWFSRWSSRMVGIIWQIMTGHWCLIRTASGIADSARLYQWESATAFPDGEWTRHQTKPYLFWKLFKAFQPALALLNSLGSFFLSPSLSISVSVLGVSLRTALPAHSPSPCSSQWYAVLCAGRQRRFLHCLDQDIHPAFALTTSSKFMVVWLSSDIPSFKLRMHYPKIRKWSNWT